jgi:HK97 family phage major capsid protein
MTVLEMREAATASAEAAREIKAKVEEEGRGLTKEEAHQVDKHMDEAERLEQEAARQERLESIESRLQKPAERKSTPELADGSKIEVLGPKLKYYRAGQLKAFTGKDANLNAYRSGRFLLATLFEHAPSRQWCGSHGIEIRRDTELDKRAMAEGINTLGGYLVPDEFEQSVIDLREKYGSARQNCRIKVMSTDHSNEPKKFSGLTAYPIGENSAFSESNQDWGNVELTAKKWGVLVRISSEISEDAIINVADDLADDAALAFATAEDESCIDGDGTSTYHGIVGIRPLMIDGNHNGSRIDVSSGCDEWSEVTTAILTSVMAALPKYARMGAKWHCSPHAKVAVFDRLLMAAGGITNAMLAAGQPPSYNGYPIEEWTAMPSDDTSAALNNVIMLFFGNMMQSSKMGVRRGMTVKRLEERYAEYDQIGIIASERMTINHHTIADKAGTGRGSVVGLLGGT